MVWMVFLIIPGTSYSQTESPEREFRGAWITTVYGIDFPGNRSITTTSDQQAVLLKMLDAATAAHLNTIIFQVRPAGDAFYESKTEPWSQWLTGTQGKTPCSLLGSPQIRHPGKS